uniref:Uncharacterized protein n=1 Tax=Gopherus evgoodei TaxID=1825980 RepID=A0A8C4W9Z4_9SAUR
IFVKNPSSFPFLRKRGSKFTHRTAKKPEEIAQPRHPSGKRSNVVNTGKASFGDPRRNPTSVIAGKSSMKAQPLVCTGGATWEESLLYALTKRNSTSVVTVGKASMTTGTSLDTRQLMFLEKSHISALTAGKVSARNQTLLDTRKPTSRRDSTNAPTAGKASARAQKSSDTREPTQQRSPINAPSVGKSSVRAQTSATTRESIQERNPTHATTAEKALTRAQH